MWLWQQSVQFKYWRFWLQLASFVLVTHLIVLYGLLFMQHGVILHDTLTITASFAQGDLPVMFMPLYKHVPGAVQQVNQAAQQAKSQRKNTKQQAQRFSYAVKAPQSVQKTQKAKVAPKKQLIKSEIKLAKIVVQQSKKTVARDKIASATISHKPDVSAPNISSVPKISALDDQITKLSPAISPTKDLETNLAEINAAITSPNNFSQDTGELNIGRKDLELLQLQDSLRNNVAQNWRPPLGFTNTLETVVELALTATGQIEKIAIKQSSGVLVFDASVQQALNTIEWPAAAWGRSHTLTFKQ